EAAKEAQVRLVVTNAEDSAAKQLSQVEDLITRKPDLLLLAPVDSDVLVSAVEAAHRANIPVITIDRTVNSDKVLTFIGVDDVAGGRAAGEYVVDRLNGKGNVIMLEGVMGSSAQRDRAQGFEEVISQYEGMKMLAKQTANFNRVEGMNVTENLLQAHPDVDAIFAQNDEMALGALRAIEAAQKQGQIIVVGFDADPEAKDAVRLGEMDATVEGSPYKLGIMGINAALQYLNGETLPEQILLPLELVTQESLTN
ncbi:MAG: D-ribose ABC transporter substrate-binding protein, partial [Firmicutes bacterium]|nr:D-ribose ABC transporter substrate-binding protein [Bacillota bacterium]